MCFLCLFVATSLLRCYNPHTPANPLQYSPSYTFEILWSMPKKRPATGSSAKVKNQLTNLQSPELAPYWLSALIESADDAIISKTLEGIITSWNAGAQRIFGYTADEVIGKSITILIPKGHENEEPAILARLRAGERIEHYETIRVRKDGKLINISLTVSPIRGPNGEIIGASKIARDVTEQRQARRALDEASERLKLASTAARLGDWSWDAETDIVRLSETAADILGVTPSATLTRAHMRELLSEGDRKATQLAVEKALAEHTDYDIEYRIKRADNHAEAWVASKGRGLYAKNGTVLGMIGFVLTGITTFFVVINRKSASVRAAESDESQVKKV